MYETGDHDDKGHRSNLWVTFSIVMILLAAGTSGFTVVYSFTQIKDDEPELVQRFGNLCPLAEGKVPVHVTGPNWTAQCKWKTRNSAIRIGTQAAGVLLALVGFYGICTKGKRSLMALQLLGFLIMVGSGTSLAFDAMDLRSAT
eukprot:TRINITY_DN854_c0_g1_i1.p1 TRINITY_DN854_c0_g1~~TRINITY_DN854_c0_g1_i1.p1  ORF type:complete len:144 (+),score=20.55 TRINITY_DN854_c0_g1_i1:329-760(+)